MSRLTFIPFTKFQRFVLKLIGAAPVLEQHLETEAQHQTNFDQLRAQIHSEQMKAARDKLDTCFEQRNLLAIALAQLIPGSGVGQDGNESWDTDWRTVVYLNLPRGQVSFHMSPESHLTAQENLPAYQGAWDGTWWNDHKPALTGFIQSLGNDLLRKDH